MTAFTAARATGLGRAVTQKAGMTALMFAAKHKHSRCVLRLIALSAAGAALAWVLRISRCSRLTALRLRVALCSLLVALCTVDLTSVDGWSALMFACESGESEAVAVLLRAGSRLEFRRWVEFQRSREVSRDSVTVHSAPSLLLASARRVAQL